MRSIIADSKRLVVKVSQPRDQRRQEADHAAIGRWAAQIAALRAQGKEVVLVSSGAIAEGMQRLGWSKRPREIDELQAAAAVGQMGTAQVYESRFTEHDIRTAQILLTHADLADRERYLNARSTMLTLLRLGVVPIINENDTVVTDEIKFGDNDTLGALVANLIEGDALIILTDQSGLFTADPRKDPTATLVAEANAERAGARGDGRRRGQPRPRRDADEDPRGEARGTGGANTVIASGREADVLVRLAAGEAIGATDRTYRADGGAQAVDGRPSSGCAAMS